MNRIYLAVTNDLSFDQRMHRICTSLSMAGYDVTLIGRKLKTSPALSAKTFHQKRLACVFNKGFLFYAEYNIRLLLFLLSKKMDAIVAIDLDTILPCFIASVLRKKKRIYDAHEFFTEMKEVRTRPAVKFFWSVIARICLPFYDHGYTVSQGLSDAFRNQYGKKYKVIRNLPVLEPWVPLPKSRKFILYQGAVNEGRGLEYLLPAMISVPYNLVVCGDGNFMNQLKELIRKHDLGSKVELKGMLLPEEVKAVTRQATLGIALSERDGINQYYALPNKFLDYIHAGLPQLTMNFPEYSRINNEFHVAELMDNLSVDQISFQINEMMENDDLLMELQKNCLEAREVFCWQKEEARLIEFYKDIFQNG